MTDSFEETTRLLGLDAEASRRARLLYEASKGGHRDLFVSRMDTGKTQTIIMAAAIHAVSTGETVAVACPTESNARRIKEELDRILRDHPEARGRIRAVTPKDSERGRHPRPAVTRCSACHAIDPSFATVCPATNGRHRGG